MISAPSVQDLQLRAVQLFAPSRLKFLFESEIAPSTIRGLDRVSAARFRKDLSVEANTIADRVLEGTYRFTPYREVLRLRGATRTPRRLAVATVRDRLVLYTLKELLHEAFPDAVNRIVPNRHIREISGFVPPLVDKAFVKTDIQSFYDSIDQRCLLELLAPFIPPAFLRLIERAIRNPILPTGDRHARKLTPLSVGVPQGLAISNILAEIFLMSVDVAMSTITLDYRRYVDDVLMFVEPGQELAARGELEGRLATLGLTLNSDKSHHGKSTEGFDYLGYHLRLPTITVKEANIHRQINRIAALLTAHTRSTDPRITKLSPVKSRHLLINELNDRITGAIADHRRYGWLFYFSEITDITLLFRLDRIVTSLWNRIRGEPRPTELKRFVRAYHEVQFNARGGYIHDYRQYDSELAMREFLETRELDEKAQDLPAREVLIRFRRAMRKNLGRLEADVGFIS